ncbi:acyl transferase/acyl hydrolase/lysophospholipase [Geopyxis carbonaria]|nr:acyl transferase/acyl hydrolase/lysophospholipase [Geopyxis carbonaria]
MADLPDFDKTFINEEDIAAFSRAIHAPDITDSDLISAHNDWRPISQRIRQRKPARKRARGKDETREGFVYTLLKWPLFVVVAAWIAVLSLFYVMTRFYISQYEYWITWRGRRQELRRRLRATRSYEEWKVAAQELDRHLGADKWKEEEEFAYYDHATVKKLVKNLRRVRARAETATEAGEEEQAATAAQELRGLLEMCVKNNFAGIESARMYSQTYYGTKNPVQDFVDEVERSLAFLCASDALPLEDKRLMFKHLSSNYGKTALCLSGGASFSYYHFGVVKAHLDANLLPNIITGTSGGALVATLICTRTDDELKKLLVPELADKITACHDATLTWIARWWRTGARFDSIDWARRGSWFTRGSMTFREAYARTGRILNISCVPSDPHSPTLLLNYLTAPDCCIFSAVLASAAVPGILNPVVLMTKTRAGTIAPYSFGSKWKDGSLRTDIPIRALNLHFNVNFSIVSQVNPHVNIFFFSSRGSVGRPVTHRRGRGWRGGFLGSALEQYLKLDLAKWLKVARHLELLPRPLSQDWSAVFLQKFDGTITIWPKTRLSDFWYILTDPTRERLDRMLEVGQRCTFAKLKFVENRLKIERLVERGRAGTRKGGSENEVERVQPEVRLRKRGSNSASTSTTPVSPVFSWLPWKSGDAAATTAVAGTAVVNGPEAGVSERRGHRSTDSGYIDTDPRPLEPDENDGGEGQTGWSSSNSASISGSDEDYEDGEGEEDEEGVLSMGMGGGGGGGIPRFPPAMDRLGL